MDSFAVCATFRPQVLFRHCDFVPDYWAELPEDEASEGFVLLPKDARETMSDGRVVVVRAASPCSSS
jgi:3-oxosteroid 1-dehydrogenase